MCDAEDLFIVTSMATFLMGSRHSAPSSQVPPRTGNIPFYTEHKLSKPESGGSSPRPVPATDRRRYRDVKDPIPIAGVGGEGSPCDKGWRRG